MVIQKREANAPLTICVSLPLSLLNHSKSSHKECLSNYEKKTYNTYIWIYVSLFDYCPERKIPLQHKCQMLFLEKVCTKCLYAALSIYIYIYIQCLAKVFIPLYLFFYVLLYCCLMLDCFKLLFFTHINLHSIQIMECSAKKPIYILNNFK